MTDERTAASPSQETSGQNADHTAKSFEGVRVPMRYSFVCESEDGRLCLFEDPDGHYAVVRSSRLA